MNNDKFNITKLDDLTSCIYLKIPQEKVVLLQSFFEIYEGIATVRTLDIKNRIVCLIVPNCNLDICFEILENIKEDIKYEVASQEDISNLQCEYVGFKNCEDIKK